MPRGGPFKERIPLAERFWSKVEKTETCWNWTGFINPSGYGTFGVGSRADGTRRSGYLAHRFAYTFLVGPIPDGCEVDHLCKNRRCVRPDHLEPATHAVNFARADLSQNGARHRIKTHCPQGHPYNESNTRRETTKRGTPGRKCRVCDAARHRALRSAKRSQG